MKKVKKYQFAGKNPCGNGTVWNEQLQQCVPITNENKTLTDVTAPPTYDWLNTSESPSNINPYKVLQPVVNNQVGSPVKQPKNPKAAFIGNNGELLGSGFNLDSDGQYRKLEYTEDKNKLEFSGGFKALNAAMDIATVIGGEINNYKQRRAENEKLLKARELKAGFNNDEKGLNNVPIYTQNGGNINNTGYLPSYQTSLNPYNIIPSNNITMEGVPHDVIGVPNVGNPLIMKKGKNYVFPGATHVFETPSLQNGGEIDEVEGLNEQNAELANAELEKGEVFQNNQGQIKKVSESEPTHENGGSLHSNVNRVLEDTSDKRTDNTSKLLKIDKETAEKLTGFEPKTSVSHSKLHELATDYYNKKLKKVEKAVKITLDYIDNNGGQYAKNSLDENIKAMQNIPTKGDLFDIIFNHQEMVKNIAGIPAPTEEMKCGGKVKKYQIAGYAGNKNDIRQSQKDKGLSNDFNKFDVAWLKDYGYEPTTKGLEKALTDLGYSDKYINPTYADGKQLPIPNNADFNSNRRLQMFLVDKNVENGDTNVLNKLLSDYGPTNQGVNVGWKEDADYSSFGDEKNPSVYYPNFVDGDLGVRTKYLVKNLLEKKKGDIPMHEDPGHRGIDVTQQKDVLPTYDKPSQNTPSKFNEPLRWYDVAGNFLNYASSLEREPVALEQLSRDYLKARELNPLPTLLQNQGDFNTVANTLPQNGIGYANQANLLGNKYKVNNEVLGQYENMNKQAKTNVDQYNEQAKFQLDQTNLGLRDQFNTRVLQSREIQRVSKLNALDDLFTKVAQNRKLNREGDLILQLTPYFDQFARFNGNKYDITQFKTDVANGRYKPQTITVNGKQQNVVLDTVTGNYINKSQVLNK